MARIVFTANLQRHVACADGAVRGATVAEALAAAFAENPLLRSYLLDDQGRLRRYVNIYVNDRAVGDRLRLSDPIAEDDEIHIFQALSGG